MPAVYYDNKDLSKITQININGISYTVINFSFMTIKDQETLVVVYKDTENKVYVSPFDLEFMNIPSSNDRSESIEPSLEVGGKKKKSKKSKV